MPLRSHDQAAITSSAVVITARTTDRLAAPPDRHTPYAKGELR